jgi:hypothetical protein
VLARGGRFQISIESSAGATAWSPPAPRTTSARTDYRFRLAASRRAGGRGGQWRAQPPRVRLHVEPQRSLCFDVLASNGARGHSSGQPSISFSNLGTTSGYARLDPAFSAVLSRAQERHAGCFSFGAPEFIRISTKEQNHHVRSYIDSSARNWAEKRGFRARGRSRSGLAITRVSARPLTDDGDPM